MRPLISMANGLVRILCLASALGCISGADSAPAATAAPATAALPKLLGETGAKTVGAAQHLTYRAVLNIGKNALTGGYQRLRVQTLQRGDRQMHLIEGEHITLDPQARRWRVERARELADSEGHLLSGRYAKDLPVASEWALQVEQDRVQITTATGARQTLVVPERLWVSPEVGFPIGGNTYASQTALVGYSDEHGLTRMSMRAVGEGTLTFADGKTQATKIHEIIHPRHSMQIHTDPSDHRALHIVMLKMPLSLQLQSEPLSDADLLQLCSSPIMNAQIRPALLKAWEPGKASWRNPTIGLALRVPSDWKQDRSGSNESILVVTHPSGGALLQLRALYAPYATARMAEAWARDVHAHLEQTDTGKVSLRSTTLAGQTVPYIVHKAPPAKAGQVGETTEMRFLCNGVWVIQVLTATADPAAGAAISGLRASIKLSESQEP